MENKQNEVGVTEPTTLHHSIKLTLQENNIKAEYNDGTGAEKAIFTGAGVTLESCLKDLLFSMYKFNEKSEDLQRKYFIDQHREKAVEMASQLNVIAKNAWFTIEKLCERVQGTKDELQQRLQYLGMFGLVNAEERTSGKIHYRVTLTKEDQLKTLTDMRADLMKQVMGLEDQIIKLQK
jgi:predicted transcriptional regulator